MQGPHIYLTTELPPLSKYAYFFLLFKLSIDVFQNVTPQKNSARIYVYLENQ